MTIGILYQSSFGSRKDLSKWVQLENIHIINIKNEGNRITRVKKNHQVRKI